MSSVLILTVGGSGEPLVKSIKQSKPDYTIFICSADEKEVNAVGSEKMVDGAGKPCKTREGEYRESIVVQAGLETEQYEKVFIFSSNTFANSKHDNVCTELQR